MVDDGCMMVKNGYNDGWWLMVDRDNDSYTDSYNHGYNAFSPLVMGAMGT